MTNVSTESINTLWKEIEAPMPMITFCPKDVAEKYNVFRMDEHRIYGAHCDVCEHAFNFYYLVLCAEGIVQ